MTPFYFPEIALLAICLPLSAGPIIPIQPEETGCYFSFGAGIQKV